MLQRVLLALAAASLAACPAETPPAAVEGNVIVGDSLARWPIFVALVDAGTNQLVTDGLGNPVAAALGLGAQTPLPYAFRNLTAGKYRVAAVANVGSDEDQTNDVFAFGLDEAEVDGAVEGKELAKIDVYLGRSDPRRTSLRGTLHVAAAYRTFPMIVAAMRGRANSTGEVVAAALPDRAADDGTRAYAMHNIEDGDYTVFAVVDVGADEIASNDDFAFAAQNLVLVDRKRGEEVTGVDLWLGMGDPEMGAITGTVTLSAALPGAEIRIVGFREDPGEVADPGVVAMRRVTPGPASGMPYALDTLPQGTYYIAAQIEDAEGKSNFKWHFTGTTDPGAIDPQGQDIADPIEVDPAIANKKDVTVDFTLGVGRVGGDIAVTGAPERTQLVAVIATHGSELKGSDVVELPAANLDTPTAPRAATYQVFGLEDGAFDIACIPDASGDGGFGDELGARYTFPGSPAKVTIAGGGRSRSDCTFDMSQ